MISEHFLDTMEKHVAQIEENLGQKLRLEFFMNENSVLTTLEKSKPIKCSVQFLLKNSTLVKQYLQIVQEFLF